MKNILLLTKLALLAATSMVLASCGGAGGDTAPAQQLLSCNVPQVPNAQGTACVDPKPLKCPAPQFPDANNEKCVIGYNPKLPEPAIYAAANQALVFFNKKGGYEGYRLHTWNDEACDAYAADSLAKSWDNGLENHRCRPGIWRLLATEPQAWCQRQSWRLWQLYYSRGHRRRRKSAGCQ